MFVSKWGGGRCRSNIGSAACVNTERKRENVTRSHNRTTTSILFIIIFCRVFQRKKKKKCWFLWAFWLASGGELPVGLGFSVWRLMSVNNWRRPDECKGKWGQHVYLFRRLCMIFPVVLFSSSMFQQFQRKGGGGLASATNGTNLTSLIFFVIFDFEGNVFPFRVPR